jgi:hypothetical protein
VACAGGYFHFESQAGQTTCPDGSGVWSCPGCGYWPRTRVGPGASRPPQYRCRDALSRHLRRFASADIGADGAASPGAICGVVYRCAPGAAAQQLNCTHCGRQPPQAGA